MALHLALIGVANAACLFASPAPGEVVNDRKMLLSVSMENPRYFADETGRAVLLTGSHVWNNLQDIGETQPPTPFDYDAYLDFLESHHHNFIRLWRWELLSWDVSVTPQWTDRSASLWVSNHPWKRVGPAQAYDTLPKFDLNQHDPDYFQRLRERVDEAANRGIYVSVMLFEGWGVQKLPDGWKSHPFHPDNNINGIDGDADRDGRGIEVHTLQNRAVTEVQKRYVREVLRTLNEMDNVLYEIANETGAYSTDWQYEMIRYIRRVESKMPQQHPVGMTFQQDPTRRQPGTNATLYKSPADWISPNPRAPGSFNFRSNPPPTDGRKVILSDTDHLWGIGGDVDWVWKSLCRGLNPNFMDPYDNAVLGKDSPNQWKHLRAAMGHARRLATRCDLNRMTPSIERASSGYCLANSGREYIVFVDGGPDVDVDLSDDEQRFRVEWIHPIRGTVSQSEAVTGGDTITFSAPFTGDAVLYLQSESVSAVGPASPATMAPAAATLHRSAAACVHTTTSSTARRFAARLL